METEIRFADGTVVKLAAGPDPVSSEWTWIPQGPCVYDVRIGAANVRAELLQAPDSQGNIRIRLNGVEQALQVVDGRAVLLERMGMTLVDDAGLDRVEAPMPGKVLSINVSAGDEVAEGDALLVLEAMKMENVIRAPRAGVLADIAPSAGQAVEKGALLVAYESES